MRKPFEINFDFPVASSNSKISINATVELHHSEPYFLVQNFYFPESKEDNRQHSILPDQEIIRVTRNGSYSWVHKDSEQESELSLAIGKGIESQLSEKEIDTHMT
jgi:hypothetical protein